MGTDRRGAGLTDLTCFEGRMHVGSGRGHKETCSQNNKEANHHDWFEIVPDDFLQVRRLFDIQGSV